MKVMGSFECEKCSMERIRVLVTMLEAELLVDELEQLTGLPLTARLRDRLRTILNKKKG